MVNEGVTTRWISFSNEVKSIKELVLDLMRLYDKSTFSMNLRMFLEVKTSSAIRFKSLGVNNPVFFAKSIKYNALALVAIGITPNLFTILIISSKSKSDSFTSLDEENILS